MAEVFIALAVNVVGSAIGTIIGGLAVNYITKRFRWAADTLSTDCPWLIGLINRLWQNETPVQLITLRGGYSFGVNMADTLYSLR